MADYMNYYQLNLAKILSNHPDGLTTYQLMEGVLENGVQISPAYLYQCLDKMLSEGWLSSRLSDSVVNGISIKDMVYTLTKSGLHAYLN